ncbi:MAG: 4Fe-4S dicluster domain-containing protein, partial [bacterium]
KLPEEIDNYEIGLNILSHMFPQVTVHVAVDKKTFEQFKTSHGFRDKIKLYSIRPKHPQGLPEVLIWSLLGDKLPYGTFPIDKGVLVLEGEVPLIVYQAVVEGKPFIRRRLGIGGPGVKKEVVVDAPVGISLKEAVDPFLCREAKFRLMIGGALTGSCQENLSLPIGKEIDSVVVLEEKIEREFLSFLRPGLRRPSYSRAFLSSLISTKRKEVDTNLHGEERPCISCGFCEQVCPADILPYQIYRCFTHNLIDEVERLKPLECIDCGLCAYVCPSKLPLTKTLKECKSKLSQEFNFVAYHKREGRLKLYKNILSDSVKEMTDTKPKG